MKMCEYANNFISLKMIYELTLERIYHDQFTVFLVKFLPEVFSTNIIIYNTDTQSFRFRVKKEYNKELYKVFERNIENEELVNAFIKNFGMFPIALEIGNISSKDIFLVVKEEFYPDLFSEKLNKHTEKRIVVIFGGD